MDSLSLRAIMFPQHLCGLKTSLADYRLQWRCIALHYGQDQISSKVQKFV